MQSHLNFTPSGRLVVSSSARTTSRSIDSDADVREAASHLNFTPVLPAGLPAGTKPIRLYTSGHDLIAVTYDLPGAWRSSHHLLWIFLANPATIGEHHLPPSRYRLRPDGRMSQAHWIAGNEAVVVVSNGLTAAELQAIKTAMLRESR